MKETKVRLSQAERELMCNAEVILTKNRVIEKVKLLLEDLQEELVTLVQQKTITGKNQFFAKSPKISRGENYLGLPYLILDYPRNFEQENIAAIRTMFWWGKFFSITLQLSGTTRILVQRNIEECHDILSRNNYYIGVNDDPWIHHFEENNYTLIGGMPEETFRQKCRGAKHLKIARKISLSSWETMPEILLVQWKFLANCCFN